MHGVSQPRCRGRFEVFYGVSPCLASASSYEFRSIFLTHCSHPRPAAAGRAVARPVVGTARRRAGGRLAHGARRGDADNPPVGGVIQSAGLPCRSLHPQGQRLHTVRCERDRPNAQAPEQEGHAVRDGDSGTHLCPLGYLKSCRDLLDF